MRRFLHEVGSWMKGVISADSPDKIPNDSSPRARNTAWLKFGLPAKRKGTELLTATGETDGLNPKPAILALGHWFNNAGDLFNWAIFENGKFSKKVAGSWTPVDAAATTPFTSGRAIISTAVAKGHLFVVNGTDRKKSDGVTVSNFGIVAPSSPVVADGGGAGNPNGTYQIALTRFNENTGHESSLSTPASISVINRTIRATFPADAFTGDTQVTHIRVHIFKEGLTDTFFQLTDTNVTPNAGAYDADAGGYTSATTFVTINVTDANINDLIIISPGEHENDPPPTGATYIAWHGSRMFATDGRYLYYSKLDNPEAFDIENDFEYVDTDNGHKILAFATYAEEHLVIIKAKGLYALIGPDDPNVWEIKEIDPLIGIVAPMTLRASEGALWWWDKQAIYRLKMGERPTRIDFAISDKLENLSTEIIHYASGEYDSLRERMVFTVPMYNTSLNNVLLPFNTKLNLWEDEWNPMDVSALGIWYDENTDSPFVALGNYRGRAFRFWTLPYVDGVRVVDGSNNPFTLSGSVTSATSNTLTKSGAVFDTNGDGLAQIPVIVESANGDIQRNIIQSNTGTVLTLQTAWTSIPDSTWTFYIGSPDWQFDTKYFAPSEALENGSVFNSRKFKEVMVKGLSDTGSAIIRIFAIIDHIDSPTVINTSVTLEGAGAVWDIDDWDDALFGSLRAKAVHRSLGKSGRVGGLRLINREPLVGVMLLGVGLRGTEHGYKE